MMHIFLDFDGTLIDSSPGIYSSFSIACQSVGLRPPPFPLFSGSIGPPIELIAQSFFPKLDHGLLQQLRIAFRADYDQKSFRLLTWHEHVIDTLQDLANRHSLSMSIITNKPTSPTVSIVEEAGLISLFNHIIGIDYCCNSGLGRSFESKAKAIDYALTLTRCSPKSCLYVGDTPSDKKAASDNNVRFVAATYGFHQWSPDELIEGIPPLHRFSDLPPLLLTLDLL